MHQWAGICKHKSHEISCSAQYQTLCACLILMSVADPTPAYTLRQLVCDIQSEGKWSDHILIRISLLHITFKEIKELVSPSLAAAEDTVCMD